MSLLRMYDYLDDRESDAEINTKVSTNTNLVKDKPETKAEVTAKCTDVIRRRSVWSTYPSHRSINKCQISCSDEQTWSPKQFCGSMSGTMEQALQTNAGKLTFQSTNFFIINDMQKLYEPFGGDGVLF